MKRPKITFGTLGRLTENDEGSAGIMVDGEEVGYIGRIVSWTKRGSSRAATSTIHGYSITMWEDGNLLNDAEFKSLADAKAAVVNYYGGRRR